MFRGYEKAKATVIWTVLRTSIWVVMIYIRARDNGKVPDWEGKNKRMDMRS